MDARETKFRIERYNGQAAREANSRGAALRVAREMTGATRLYRGAANYQTDWADGEDRGYGYATDYWTSRRNASQEMSGPADVVIVQMS